MAIAVVIAKTPYCLTDRIIENHNITELKLLPVHNRFLVCLLILAMNIVDLYYSKKVNIKTTQKRSEVSFKK